MKMKMNIHEVKRIDGPEFTEECLALDGGVACEERTGSMVRGHLPDIVFVQCVVGTLRIGISERPVDPRRNRQTWVISGVTNEKDIQPQILA
jgi:hypothetical protein